LASATPPATISAPPASSAALTGSRSTVNAIATATRGAVPITTDVRAAPASLTARTKKICEAPGAIAPATRNGQASTRSVPRAATRQIAAVSASATDDIASDPSSTSSNRRIANRTATDIAPNSAAEAHASRTAATQAARSIGPARSGDSRTRPAYPGACARLGQAAGPSVSAGGPARSNS
jgi:hypothetical protein